ncbi:MAG TPA: hypothetical protein VF494_13735 [Candidatus Limnocylindrales bacterium]
MAERSHVKAGRSTCTWWVAIAVLVGACAGAVSSTPVPLWTLASPRPICMLARYGGTLVADPITGLGLQDTNGDVAHVRWPSGYTARPEGASVVLRDDQGRAVAQMGDQVSLGGGYGLDGVIPSSELRAIVACPGTIEVHQPPAPTT